MIVTTKDDMVRLSGALVKNQWLTIKAAANLLLHDRPEGIIIDCEELEHVSEEGARTFLDAMRDIQVGGSRIMVCNLPENVLRVVRTVPGVRSQLPIAATVEQARASLRLSQSAPSAEAEGPGGKPCLLVPITEGMDIEYSVLIASRLAHDMKLPVRIVYLMQVARNLPLGAPLPEEEDAANLLLERAEETAHKQGIVFTKHVERVRDLLDGLLLVVKNYRASHVIVSLYADRVNDELFTDLIAMLLRRTPCNVLIGRQQPDATHPSPCSAFPGEERSGE